MPGNLLTLLCCLEGSTPEDGYLHQAKDIVVAPGEPFFNCQWQPFCSLGAWKVLHGRTGSCGIGPLPRLVLSRAYDGRPKAKRLLSPQKLFDLFPSTGRFV